MPARHFALRSALIAALLLPALPVRAAPAGNIEERVVKTTRYTQKERSQKQAYIQDVSSRANNLLALILSEMSLIQGNGHEALQAYMTVLKRTKDPEVAARAMDIATELNAQRQIDAIYRQWQEIDPQHNDPVLKLFIWSRNLVRGEYDAAADGLADLLEQADEELTRRIFLVTAQTAIQKPEATAILAAAVHRQAKSRENISEAVIADAIFSTFTGKEQDALNALQRLSRLDGDILPPTQLTLRLISERQPELLNRFFDQTDAAKLSPMWREVQINSLIHSKQYERAYQRLQQLLAEQPDPDLYIQAGLLAVNQKASTATVLNYFGKAVQTGTQDQQSRAALFAAMRLVDDADYPQAREWISKIQSPSYAFDKAVMTASLDTQDSRWDSALAAVKRAQKLENRQGLVFDEQELARIELFAVSKQSDKQAALNGLNHLYRQAVEQEDEARISDILYQRGLLYADQLQQPEQAVADLKEYVRRNPDSHHGMNALGYSMLALPDPDLNEAKRLIQEAYRQDPEEPAISDSMGWVLFRLGDVKAALPYLEKAFKGHPDPEVAAHYGEALWVHGEQERAKTVFAEGLRQKEGNFHILHDTLRRLNISLPEEKK